MGGWEVAAVVMKDGCRGCGVAIGYFIGLRERRSRVSGTVLFTVVVEIAVGKSNW